MPKTITLEKNTKSIQCLCAKDKRLAKVIAMVGKITYRPYADSYSFLVETIIGQMLSNKVADVLCGRLRTICNGSVTPEVINSLTDERIKIIGISKSKVGYIRNLTEAVASGTIDFAALSTLPDSEIIKKLTSVRGIGIWSAKMYLIFVLDRQDVLPMEDGAFLQSYSWLYQTNELKPAAVAAKCKKWKPYSSIAARYLYKALDKGLTKEKFQ